MQEVYWFDSVVVLQMDRGKFHSAQHLDWAENIIHIFQPAHSPYLAAIERVWEHLKAQLRWENCQSLKQLRLRLSDLLEELTPNLIASLTAWEFITTAVLSSSSQ